MSETRYIVLPWQGTGRLCVGRVEGDEVVGVWFSDIKFEPCAYRWQVKSWTEGRFNNTVYPTVDEVERFLMAAAMGVYYPIPEWGLTEEKICLLSQR